MVDDDAFRKGGDDRASLDMDTNRVLVGRLLVRYCTVTGGPDS